MPITNSLLEKQIASQESMMQEQMSNFGRGEIPEGMTPPGSGSGNMPSAPGRFGGFGGDMGEFFGKMGDSVTEYVTEIDSATNLTVVFQLMGVGILLTLISSLFAIIFVLRYDPLKIMANRE